MAISETTLVWSTV